eukprot:15842-Pleurochrysis_carterae.AAC.1
MPKRQDVSGNVRLSGHLIATCRNSLRFEPRGEAQAIRHFAQRKVRARGGIRGRSRRKLQPLRACVRARASERACVRACVRAC